MSLLRWLASPQPLTFRPACHIHLSISPTHLHVNPSKSCRIHFLKLRRCWNLCQLWQRFITNPLVCYQDSTALKINQGEMIKEEGRKRKSKKWLDFKTLVHVTGFSALKSINWTFFSIPCLYSWHGLLLWCRMVSEYLLSALYHASAV